jgi:hypothetical protein
MNNIPDEMFRRKLEHLENPPPARAWERIERGMRRKRITPWLAIAASLLLAITASALILTRQSGSDTREIADKQLPGTPATPDTAKVTHPHQQVEQSGDAIVTDVPEPQAQPAPRAAVPSPIVPDATVAANTTPLATDAPPAEEDIPTVDAIEDSVPTLIADASPEDRTPVKIVLEAGGVQARYLKKKSEDEATEEVAKASGLRKLLDKAEQIQKEDPIGDLRQMKNEIFALNFPGKKRDQNK